MNSLEINWSLNKLSFEDDIKSHEYGLKVSEILTVNPIHYIRFGQYYVIILIILTLIFIDQFKFNKSVHITFQFVKINQLMDEVGHLSIDSEINTKSISRWDYIIIYCKNTSCDFMNHEIKIKTLVFNKSSKSVELEICKRLNDYKYLGKIKSNVIPKLKSSNKYKFEGTVYWGEFGIRDLLFL